MPPVPGKPPVPKGLYPVDYNDLCTLSGLFCLLNFKLKFMLYMFEYLLELTKYYNSTEERADILLRCFGLDEFYDLKKLNIRDKISEIAGFMGVWMKGEFMREYDEWERTQEWEQVMHDIRVGNWRERSVTLELD